MKFVISFFGAMLVLTVSAMPNGPTKDIEIPHQASTPSQPSFQMGTMVDNDSSIEGMSSSNDNPNYSHKNDDSSESSEMLGFNLSLLPTSSVFGANPMFQKLQESLRVIRDQLNALWSFNEDNRPPFDLPDNYSNSTSHSKFINGTLVTVNETIFKTTNQDGIQSFYHTKAISVYPDNETDTTHHKENAHEKGQRVDHTPMQNYGMLQK
ncbi:uncharacterized protein LOC130685904 [Daphnia carinata]|uniref:uncharacterized protein LOC130685904 n=1 Tax=Daphnia carinata TaxID=120202 RepID=UPI00257DC772|nr:uncharacterized protein LOC130685904 [Daphnia carinata]